MPNGPLDEYKEAMEELVELLKPEKGAKKFAKTLSWNFDKKKSSERLSD